MKFTTSDLTFLQNQHIRTNGGELSVTLLKMNHQLASTSYLPMNVNSEITANYGLSDTISLISPAATSKDTTIPGSSCGTDVGLPLPPSLKKKRIPVEPEFYTATSMSESTESKISRLEAEIGALKENLGIMEAKLKSEISKSTGQILEKLEEHTNYQYALFSSMQSNQAKVNKGNLLELCRGILHSLEQDRGGPSTSTS